VHGLAAWTDGLASVAGGQLAPAVAAFDRAATLLRQAGQPDAAAQTQVPKIMALSLLGQPEQATACAEAAQAELLALGNVAAATMVSLNLGGLLQRRSAFKKSARHYRQAAVLFARLGNLQHSVLADIGLAHALASLGEFDEALRIYARVRMRAGKQALAYPLTVVDGLQARCTARGSASKCKCKCRCAARPGLPWPRSPTHKGPRLKRRSNLPSSRWKINARRCPATNCAAPELAVFVLARAAPAGRRRTFAGAARRAAGFSNPGSWVDKAAPGEGITSSFPGGLYATWSGTSMAAPLAAGTAALVRAWRRAGAYQDPISLRLA
jgi:tetratricopeptide (TPR) repeat protein